MGERDIPLWVAEGPTAGLPVPGQVPGQVPGPGRVPLWVKDLAAPGPFPGPSDHTRLRIWDGTRWADAPKTKTKTKTKTTTHRGGDTTSGDCRQLRVAPGDTDVPAVALRDEKRSPIRATLFSSFTRAHGISDDDTPTPRDMAGSDAGASPFDVDIDVDVDDTRKPPHR